MAGIWTDDDLRDDCEDDARMEEQQLAECEMCGAAVERLFTVEDRDDSVGYRGEVIVCDDCLKRGRRRR